MQLEKGAATLALHDLTGFEGRCDAMVLANEKSSVAPPNEPQALAEFRRNVLHWPESPRDAGQYDFVVAGGGIAGVCAAISGARLGLKTALIHDRPVLGGNNSAEVRVHARQKTNLPPLERIGDVAKEVSSIFSGTPIAPRLFADERRLQIVRAEPNLDLFLNTHACGVEMKGSRIAAVIGRHILTSEELRFPAWVFADCTGDGNLGFLAGADFRYGRESRRETGETLAPEQADLQTNGTSVLWTSTDEGRPSEFPDCPWALKFEEAACQHVTTGEWNWEGGFRRHTVDEAELIRDYFFRAIYGNWAFQKNHSRKQEQYANRRLDWVAFVAGKRESRRLLGDVILTEQDIRAPKEVPRRLRRVAVVHRFAHSRSQEPGSLSRRRVPEPRQQRGRGPQHQGTLHPVAVLVLEERRQLAGGGTLHQHHSRRPRRHPSATHHRHDGRGRGHGREALQEPYDHAARRLPESLGRIQGVAQSRRGKEGGPSRL